jgi:uncharacterized protein (DUF58 family)
MSAEELRELLNLPLELAVSVLSRSLLSGGIQTRKPRGGETFLVTREYRFGDPLRTIDFRGSARRNRWLVRERERYSTLRLALWLDTTPSMVYTPPVTKFDLLKLFAGVVGAKALSRNHQVYLIGSRGDIFSFYTPIQVPLFLDRISALQANEEWMDGSSFPASLDLVILISDFMDPAQLHLLEKYLRTFDPARVELRFLQILHPDEVDFGFPRDRVFLFSDLEASSLKRKIQPASARDSYLQRVEEHWQRVKTLAQRYSARFWRWVLLRDDAVTALRFLFFG